MELIGRSAKKVKIALHNRRAKRHPLAGLQSRNFFVSSFKYDVTEAPAVTVTCATWVSRSGQTKNVNKFFYIFARAMSSIAEQQKNPERLQSVRKPTGQLKHLPTLKTYYDTQAPFAELLQWRPFYEHPFFNPDDKQRHLGES